MAKAIKTKRISITSFDKVMKETNTATEKIEWNGLEITINKTLSFRDVLGFVDTVTKSCFTVDDNIYLPEVKDFVIKCCVLEMYANFSLPANVEHKYDLIYNTDAYEIVKQHINPIQFEEIIISIDRKIDALVRENAEAINKQMNELYSAFNNIQTQMDSLFSGINSDEVINFMGAITNSKLDENKLIQAYKKENQSSDGE